MNVCIRRSAVIAMAAMVMLAALPHRTARGQVQPESCELAAEKFKMIECLDPPIRSRGAFTPREGVILDPETGQQTKATIDYRRLVGLRVEFPLDSARVTRDTEATLSELGKALADPALANSKFFINGHTDERGPDEYNLKLSQRRANEVRERLIREYGIAPDRLLARGFGLSVPRVRARSEEAYQRNRRVEVERRFEEP